MLLLCCFECFVLSTPSISIKPHSKSFGSILEKTARSDSRTKPEGTVLAECLVSIYCEGAETEVRHRS